MPTTNWTPGLPDKAVGTVWLSVRGPQGRHTVMGWVGMAWQGRYSDERSTRPQLELTLRIPDPVLDISLERLDPTQDLRHIEAWQPFVRPAPWKPASAGD